MVHRALQYPEVRARRVGKLDEDVCHMEELKWKENVQCVSGIFSSVQQVPGFGQHL